MPGPDGRKQARAAGLHGRSAPDAAGIARRLSADLETAGADALNLRVHAPGLSPGAVREQIEELGRAVSLLR